MWFLLTEPSVRAATPPWGIIWQTARRAVLGEVLAARWGTNWRKAWEHDAAERADADHHPISIEALAETGHSPESVPTSLPDTTPTAVSIALESTTATLVAAGWADEDAARIVVEIAAMEECLGCGATITGWRPLAVRLGVPRGMPSA